MGFGRSTVSEEYKVTRVHIPQILTRPGTAWFVVLALSLGLLVAGCGIAGGNTPAHMPTVNLTASPTSINAGSTATLTVSATNANQVTITGTDGSSYSLSAAGGTQTVTPQASTTYTATATGNGGTATATAAVTVNGTAASPTVTITANPTSITTGQSSTLTVTATNATSVVVTGSDGSTYSNFAATGGTQSVTPTASTTYTAVATGTAGKAVATATVTVTTSGPPTVSITANPTSITTGQSSILTVAATNATGVTISGTDGSTYTLATSGGTQSVSPASTTTYTATATGPGGNVTATVTLTVNTAPPPTVTLAANPTSITDGQSSTLTATAANSTGVVVTGSDGSSYTLAATGGTQSVSPTSTTTYTATATGPGGSATATAAVTVVPAASLQSITHVIFMMQENHSFDNYMGMLNPYRAANNMQVSEDGNTYTIDGIDDKLNTISNENDEGTSYSLFKLKSTCIDDDSSAWLASYGDVNRYDFLTTRPILTDGFVHTAEGYAKSCAVANSCSGSFSDTAGQRAMGYYDQGFLNYYYYMASQFSMSDRWFSPVSSKTIDNRIATFTGGTTQGLVNDPGTDDHLPQLGINTIFQSLDQAKVSWKIYYTVTQGFCKDYDECPTNQNARFPATTFTDLSYSYNYLYENPSGAPCRGTTQPSSVEGDTTNSFCVDPNHIALLSQYYTDLTNGTLPSFAFIEAGYGNNDEHPGSGQSVLLGQAEMASIMNAFMSSSEWSDSVFFFAYDEGGGPYDHVPPVPGHSNDNTDAAVVANYPDIKSIAVNPDSYFPCVPQGGTATTHCDLSASDPGANPNDAPAVQGFAAQLGFRIPNFVLSPYVRKHYVSHIPMDHTAIIRFVEDRFIGNGKYLTARDAAQPTLLDFFDFTNVPWSQPPSPPAPVTQQTLGYNPCTPGDLGP